MADYLAEVIDQVRTWEADDPRSRQAELGWSELAGCRAYVGFKLRGAWASDDTDNWRADVGTALHEWLRQVRDAAMPLEDVEFEVETSYRGVLGHADEVNRARNEVTDYKFPALRSADVWRDREVIAEKMIQLHGYAAGLIEDGRLSEGCTVRLLVCPVDGTMADWWTHEETFDRQVADDAVDSLLRVTDAVETGEELSQDKPWFWCSRFCEFFSQCRLGPGPDDFPEIVDAELAAAVERYGEAVAQASAADKVKKETAPLLRGLRGKARGFKVYMTRPGKPTEVLDEDAVYADYEASGLEPPMRRKPGAKASLYVVKER